MKIKAPNNTLNPALSTTVPTTAATSLTQLPGNTTTNAGQKSPMVSRAAATSHTSTSTSASSSGGQGNHNPPRTTMSTMVNIGTFHVPTNAWPTVQNANNAGSPRRQGKGGGTPGANSAAAVAAANAGSNACRSPVSRQLFPGDRNRHSTQVAVTATKTTVTYTSAVSAGKAKTVTSSANMPHIKMSDHKAPVAMVRPLAKSPAGGSTGGSMLQQNGSSHIGKPGQQPLLPMKPASQNSGPPPQNQQAVIGSVTTSQHGEYSPFHNFFNAVDQVTGNKKEDPNENRKNMNFASVAAAGVISSSAGPLGSNSPGPPRPPSEHDPNLPAKAPGYKPKSSLPPGGDGDHMRAPGFKAMMQQAHQHQHQHPGHQHPGHHALPGGPGNVMGLPFSMPPVGELDMNQVDNFRAVMAAHHHMSPHHSGTSTPSLSSQSPSSMGFGFDHEEFLRAGRIEYSTPHQPMTLPKIESTLNPNAPDFRSSRPDLPSPPGPGGIGTFIANSAFTNLPSSMSMVATAAGIPPSLRPQHTNFIGQQGIGGLPAQNFLPASNLAGSDLPQFAPMPGGFGPAGGQVPRQYSPLPPTPRSANTTPSAGASSKGTPS